MGDRRPSFASSRATITPCVRIGASRLARSAICPCRPTGPSNGGLLLMPPTIDPLPDNSTAPPLHPRNMSPGEMRSLLDAEGIRLTRSLGQNFLHDANQLQRITTLAHVPAGNPVLEIGPGLGPLSERLLALSLPVVAVEKDQRLATILQRRFAANPHFQLIVADALDWLRQPLPFSSPWHVVSNLPYSVASPILVDLARLTHPPQSITVTLQTEVADRLRAAPNTPEYGALTLYLARTFTIGDRFRIPAACFFPAPNVESTCLRLVLRPTPLVPDFLASTFDTLVRHTFGQRRKQLRKVLRAHWPEDRLLLAWQHLNLAPEVRGETLPPESFARLAHFLAPNPSTNHSSPGLPLHPDLSSHPQPNPSHA